MSSDEIEHNATKIAILCTRTTRCMSGFVASYSSMMNAVVCIPHLSHYTYDNAGNLVEESNPLVHIFYGYTYYRVLEKRYSHMTGNIVTYTYGTSGAECIGDGWDCLDELRLPLEDVPRRMDVSVVTEYVGFADAMDMASNEGVNPEVYFYHGDHLGSASWFTK